MFILGKRIDSRMSGVLAPAWAGPNSCFLILASLKYRTVVDVSVSPNLRLCLQAKTSVSFSFLACLSPSFSKSLVAFHRSALWNCLSVSSAGGPHTNLIYFLAAVHSIYMGDYPVPLALAFRLLARETGRHWTEGCHYFGYSLIELAPWHPFDDSRQSV